MPAGYSGTPQAKKLGIKPHQRLCPDDPPDDWSLTDPPSGVILVPPPSLPTSSSASSAPAMNSPSGSRSWRHEFSSPMRSELPGLAAQSDTAATSQRALCGDTPCHSDWST